MLFADKRVVGAVEKSYVAAWESVEPLKIAEFDLGDGARVRGAYGGNIALYFCTPDGVVLDVLGGLHDPEKVVAELAAAADLAGAAERAPEGRAAFLAGWHDARRGTLVALEGGKSIVERAPIERMVSKGIVFAPRERIDIVVPGGYEVYKQRAHALLAAARPGATPAELKEAVYAGVLREPLGSPPPRDLRQPTSLMLVPEGRP